MRKRQRSLHNAYKSPVELRPDAVAAAAAAVYFFEPATIAASLLAALVHELGHFFCLRVMRARVTGFRMEAQGCCIAYSGADSPAARAFVAASGPAVGILGAYLFSLLANALDSSCLSLASGLSLTLSAFNLLPVLPLDGGWLILAAAEALFGQERGARLCCAVGLLFSSALLAAGIWVMRKGMGIGVLVTALWLLLSADPRQTIEKTGKIM